MTLPHGYEMVIGLEVHAQVTTSSKLFSGAATAVGAEPNTQASPIDLGMPGMLPVLNSAAVDAGIKLGLAIGAHIAPTSVFARKNYFYPDLPKGYQISQYDQPIVQGGTLAITLPDGTQKTINITRMHLEEDAGKSLHDIAPGVSHVDLNRAGVPLMEIVSEPELRTPEEAGAYMRAMRQLVRWLGICDGNLENGNLRCDANISVRKIDSNVLNTRCEIKNLNSIRHIMAAIQHEAERQVHLHESGQGVQQQTRLWDPDAHETRALRSKEDAHDYRYFPDPDLIPLHVTPQRIAAVQATMPLLPHTVAATLAAQGLSAQDITLLTEDRANYAYFQQLLEGGQIEPKLAANWLTGELFAALNKLDKPIEESPITAPQLAELLGLLAGGQISGKIAKQVFAEMLATGQSAAHIVQSQGLSQISDTGALEKLVAEAIANNPEVIAKYKAGNARVLGSLVGQIMKATGGQANPELVNQLLLKALT